MRQLWQRLDALLRARETAYTESALQQISLAQLLSISVLLAAVYGFFMGWFAVFSRPEPEWLQVVSCLWKVPALFLLTLFICFPSLYVFSTLLGSRLSFGQTLKLLVVIVTLMVTVLASFGPIVAFFSLSTENYYFMKLLNVAFFAVAGGFGVSALLKALRSMLRSFTQPPPGPSERQGDVTPPPLIRVQLEESDQLRRVNTVFRIWIVIFGLVGAQMGWVLRPFLGHPHSPFAVFRSREANFFIDVWQSILRLFD